MIARSTFSPPMVAAAEPRRKPQKVCLCVCHEAPHSLAEAEACTLRLFGVTVRLRVRQTAQHAVAPIQPVLLACTKRWCH